MGVTGTQFIDGYPIYWMRGGVSIFYVYTALRLVSATDARFMALPLTGEARPFTTLALPFRYPSLPLRYPFTSLRTKKWRPPKSGSRHSIEPKPELELQLCNVACGQLLYANDRGLLILLVELLL